MKTHCCRFSGDEIIYWILILCCLLLLLWCVFACFHSCIPGEHFLIKLWYWPADDIFCPNCGELLRSVSRCDCGATCSTDFCVLCGLEQ